MFKVLGMILAIIIKFLAILIIKLLAAFFVPTSLVQIYFAVKGIIDREFKRDKRWILSVILSITFCLNIYQIILRGSTLNIISTLFLLFIFAPIAIILWIVFYYTPQREIENFEGSVLVEINEFLQDFNIVVQFAVFYYFGWLA